MDYDAVIPASLYQCGADRATQHILLTDAGIISRNVKWASPRKDAATGKSRSGPRIVWQIGVLRRLALPHLLVDLMRLQQLSFYGTGGKPDTFTFLFCGSFFSPW